MYNHFRFIFPSFYINTSCEIKTKRSWNWKSVYVKTAKSQNSGIENENTAIQSVKNTITKKNVFKEKQKFTFLQYVANYEFITAWTGYILKQAMSTPMYLKYVEKLLSSRRNEITHYLFSPFRKIYLAYLAHLFLIPQLVKSLTMLMPILDRILIARVKVMNYLTRTIISAHLESWVSLGSIFGDV